MAGPGAIFREVHRLRKQAKALTDEIERLPRQLKAQQAKVVARETAQREAQDAVKHLKVVVRDKEASLKSRHDLIAKKEKQKNESSGKPEVYEAILKELAHARAECQQLEDDILLGMGETDEQASRLPDFEKAVQEARHEVVQFEKNQSSRIAGLKAQLQECLAQLKAVEATLPDENRPAYQRIATARGEDGLAPVRDGYCTACHTGLITQDVANVNNLLFIVCKSCGRILYPADEARA